MVYWSFTYEGLIIFKSHAFIMANMMFLKRDDNVINI